MTAAEHIAAAERALERAEAPHATQLEADRLLRIAEAHTRLAAVIQAEARQSGNQD